MWCASPLCQLQQPKGYAFGRPSEVTDTFWCMDGPMVIEMRAPRESVELAPGQMHAVPAKRAHRVTGKGGERCRFAILQGIGTYDFQPVGGA